MKRNHKELGQFPHTIVVTWPVAVDRFKRKTLEAAMIDFRKYVEYAFQQQVKIEFMYGDTYIYWTQSVPHNNQHNAVQTIDTMARQFAKRADLILGAIDIHKQILDIHDIDA